MGASSWPLNEKENLLKSLNITIIKFDLKKRKEQKRHKQIKIPKIRLDSILEMIALKRQTLWKSYIYITISSNNV